MVIGNPVKLTDSAARHPKGAELWVLFLTSSVWRESEGGGMSVGMFLCLVAFRKTLFCKELLPTSTSEIH